MEYAHKKGFETKFNCQIRFTNVTSNVTANTQTQRDEKIELRTI